MAASQRETSPAFIAGMRHLMRANPSHHISNAVSSPAALMRLGRRVSSCRYETANSIVAAAASRMIPELVVSELLA
jgi:hypothetical protein